MGGAETIHWTCTRA